MISDMLRLSPCLDQTSVPGDSAYGSGDPQWLEDGRWSQFFNGPFGSRILSLICLYFYTFSLDIFISFC